MMPPAPVAKDRIVEVVATALNQHPILDFHSHLYAPRFGTPSGGRGSAVDAAGLMLWGIDELLTYHYLLAELFRVVPANVLTPEQFGKLGKREQADVVWRYLFVERSPLSEACRGVLTTLQALGLETSPQQLPAIRRFYGEQDPDAYVDRVMELAHVRSITMTNDVFDDNERNRWLTSEHMGGDSRFSPVLRLDLLLCSYSEAARKLAGWGYAVGESMQPRTIEEARRFVRDWIERMKPLYLAASMPSTFVYPAPEGSAGGGQAMLEHVVLPECAEHGLPFAMMIGTKRGANPRLGQAGDMLGKASVQTVANLCRQFPENKFFVTMLSRENQHELCVAARKFGNLMLFGCWWFLNTPSMIEEMTRMRVELLGTSFIPQHSDARVLDQLIYKWAHSRQVIAKVLAEKYVELCQTGWPVTQDSIERDTQRLFTDNFRDFIKQ